MPASAVRTCSASACLLACSGGRDGYTEVPAPVGNRRRARGAGLAVHVPVLHPLPARGRPALLVLQLHALPGADAALLARFGVLAEAEDVFQLHHTEVDQALSDVMLAWAAGGPPLGGAYWKPIVASRKRMLAALRDWSPPPALGPVPTALNDPAVRMLWGVTQERIEAWLSPSSDEIRGFGASSGVVEGPARVLTDVNQIGEIRDGEILVCPVTAPSWAPVFGKIKAAVSDIGGSMSHAAIVAREYGLPAVVGTGDATKRISTGQLVRVDGDRGIVQVIG